MKNKVKYENLGTECYNEITLSKCQAWINFSEQNYNKLEELIFDVSSLNQTGIVSKAISRPLNEDTYNKEIGEKVAIDKADRNTLKMMSKKLTEMINNTNAIKEELLSLNKECVERINKIEERKIK